MVKRDILGLDDAHVGKTLVLSVTAFDRAAELLGKSRSQLLKMVGAEMRHYDEWVKTGVPHEVITSCTRFVKEAGKLPKGVAILTPYIYSALADYYGLDSVSTWPAGRLEG